MRLIDASVFIHAYLKPKRKLKNHEIKIKESAKRIVKRINDGENVYLTIPQLTEIANLVEHLMPLEHAEDIEEFLLTSPNIRLVAVSKNDYIDALKISKDMQVGLNDCVAFVVMREKGVKEIYSFDSDFDRLGVKRVTN